MRLLRILYCTHFWFSQFIRIRERLRHPKYWSPSKSFSSYDTHDYSFEESDGTNRTRKLKNFLDRSFRVKHGMGQTSEQTYTGSFKYITYCASASSFCFLSFIVLLLPPFLGEREKDNSEVPLSKYEMVFTVTCCKYFHMTCIILMI